MAAFYLLVFAGAAKALAIVAFYRRAYVVLDTRQGNNRITDTPFWRWAGAVTEFACFCAMLGLTIQFYSTCWSSAARTWARLRTITSWRASARVQA